MGNEEEDKQMVVCFAFITVDTKILGASKGKETTQEVQKRGRERCQMLRRKVKTGSPRFRRNKAIKQKSYRRRYLRMAEKIAGMKLLVGAVIEKSVSFLFLDRLEGVPPHCQCNDGPFITPKALLPLCGTGGSWLGIHL